MILLLTLMLLNIEIIDAPYQGHYEDGTIYLNCNLRDMEMVSVFIHELQHSVQSQRDHIKSFAGLTCQQIFSYEMEAYEVEDAFRVSNEMQRIRDKFMPMNIYWACPGQ